MIGIGVGISARDAYFIKEAGPDKLPYVYIINSLLISFTTLFYTYLVDRLSLYTVCNILSLFFCIVLVIIRFLMNFQLIWLPYAVHSIGEMILVMVVIMHFWSYANFIFDPREGKRTFPIIGACGLIGGIIGGFITKVTVHHVGNANLFLIWGLLMGSTILLNRKVHLSMKVGLSEKPDVEADNTSLNLLQMTKKIWQSPLIRALTYISLPMWLVSWFVDYKFFMAMDEVFTSKNDLNAFLGVFFSGSAFVGLLVQSFITSKLLRRFGPGSLMLIYPFSMIIGAIALILRYHFTTYNQRNLFSFRPLSAAWAKFTDHTVLYSLHESAMQLLFNAIPEKQRPQCRAFISGPVEQGAIIIAGLMLIFYTHKGYTSGPLVYTILILSIIWALLSLRINKIYIRELVNNLKTKSLRDQSIALQELNTSHGELAFQTLLAVIRDGDKTSADIAITMLSDIKSPRQLMQLYKSLQESKEQVKISLLGIFISTKHKEALTYIIPLISHPAPEVRAAALRSARLTGIDNDDLIVPLVNDADLNVRTEAMIYCMQHRNPQMPMTTVTTSLNKMVHEGSNEEKIKAVQIIGEVASAKFQESLLSLCRDIASEVQDAAIRSCRRYPSAQVIDFLVPYLDHKSLHRSAAYALINMGEDALPRLLQCMLETEPSELRKIELVSCIGKIGSATSVSILINILPQASQTYNLYKAVVLALNNIRNAQKNIKANLIQDSTKVKFIKPNDSNYLTAFLHDQIHDLNRYMVLQLQLVRHRSYPNARLIMNAVEEERKERLDLILTNLELFGNSKSIQVAKNYLYSSNQRKYAEALEILDGCSSAGKTLVNVLEQCDRTQLMSVEKKSMPELICTFFKEPHKDWTVACALFIASQNRLTEITDIIEIWADSQRQNIHSSPLLTAHYMLYRKNLGLSTSGPEDTKENERMEINMKRILFLHTIPLFSDVVGPDLHLISSIVEEKNYKEGEVIFEKNDPGNALYIIEKGVVRIAVDQEHKQIIALLHERDSFGEMSIIDHEPRSAGAIAEKDSHLLMISSDNFKELILSRPQISLAVMKNISLRLRDTLIKLEKHQSKELSSDSSFM